MPTFNSPGTYVIEKDISEYAPVVDSSVVGIAGFADKGPVNLPTLITSPQQLHDVFGRPSENIPGQGLEGSIEILEATNKIYFVRAVVTTTAADASATIQIGSCPSIAVSSNGFGVTQNIYFKVDVTNNAGVSQFVTTQEYSITSGIEATQAAAIKTVVGGDLDSSLVGAYFTTATAASGFLAGSFAGSGATLSVSAYSDSAFTTGVSALAAVDASGGEGVASSSLTVSGISCETANIAYVVESLYPGAGYNLGTFTDGSTSGNSIEIDALGAQKTALIVNEEGVTKESYNISLHDTTFVEDVINTGLVNAVSDVIKGNIVSGLTAFTSVKLTNFEDQLTGLGVANIPGRDSTGVLANVNPRFVKLVEGTTGLTGGNSGLGTTGAQRATAVIGDATVNPKTGIQSFVQEDLNISIAGTPGITDESVQNALVTLATNTQDFIAVMSAPFGSINTAQEAIQWHNGQTQSRAAAINSSFAAIYWPWVKVFSVHDGKEIFMDPCVYGIRTMCVTDSVEETWSAPAGFVRGRLTKPTDVEVKLSKGDRDSMYSGGNAINPIVNFPQQGITVFGQRTAQRAPSALDRIGVRRMLITIRKVILQSTTSLVFEPNDKYTWERVGNLLNPFLDDIRRRRGITKFKVVCDETTNTPARIDRNELWCKILIKPTQTAEVLVFEINITNQSAQLGS